MNNKKTFLRAAIMVGLMFAVLLMAMSSVQASPGEVILDDNVENVTWSAAYWTNTNRWHITTPGGCNCTDNNSWYYGQEPPCDYDIGNNWGYLRSQDIDLTGVSGATLTFWTHWLTEDTGTKWDKKLVQVSTDGGSSWTTVKQLSGTENDKTISVNLTGYVNETIQIQFYFDTIDWMYNNYYGWCIDDIKVEKEVPYAPGIDVEKTVWNGTAWVDEITANISDTVRFNCTIHNTGTFNLTNINVTDILSESLEYAGNATVNGTLQEPDWNVSNQFGWNFTGPLEPCQTIPIEFNASVVKCGVDNNTQFATGWCNDTGEWVYDNDTVTINVPPKPDLVITKTATYSNGNLTVNYTVNNSGACACADANESWVGIYINGTFNKTVFVPSLPKYNSNTSEVVIEGVECPCGTILNVTVCADYNNFVVECNETNNCEVNMVACPPGEPDLKITYKLETWLNMTHYNITYTVKNIGGAKATNVTRTNITIDDSQVENDTVEVLNASESHTATFGPYELSDDNDTIRICADIDGNVSEHNESNNCLQNTLHRSTTIEVNTTGWWVSPEGEFHSSPNTPIQDAINNVSGSTIIVHDGTYNVETTITIGTANLTLKSSDGAATTIINATTVPTAFEITANGVTLGGDGTGLTINGTLGTTSGVRINTAINGVTIQDNNFTNNYFGIYMINKNVSVTVTNNTITAPAGSADLTWTNAQVAIYFNSGGNDKPYMLMNSTITENTISNYEEGIQFWAVNNTVISNNVISDCSFSGIAVDRRSGTNTTNVTISGNTVTNVSLHATQATGIAIDKCKDGDIGVNVTNITIENNTVADCTLNIALKRFPNDDPITAADMSTITVQYNNITGGVRYGLYNGHTPAVNATHNWWNDTCGPGPVGPGSGDNVSDNVTYTPWLDAPYPGGEPVESCARVYFKPENSSALYCNTTDVEIWVNATGDFQSGQINLTYNQTCANVTDWTRNDTNFGFGGRTHKNGSDRISFARNNSQTGKYMIGTLTIHCVNSSEKGYNTTLNFDNGSELFDDLGETLPVEWTNGTFNCTGILCGDVNCDGDVNVGDATLVLNHWTDPGEYLLCNEWAGDVNCDHTINVGDATLILNYFFGHPLNCCTV